MSSRPPVPRTVVNAVNAAVRVARRGQAELDNARRAMTVRPPAPAVAPPEERETRPRHLAAADDQLARYGWPQARAYRVYSAGDSGSGREEILFVARDGRAITARVGMLVAAGKRIQWLEIEAGW
jgi:hypothetical protein